VFVDISPVCLVELLSRLASDSLPSPPGCPYEGNVANETTLSIIREFFSMGCYEVSLGDTIGAGTPQTTHELLSYLARNHVPLHRLSMHFHDTHNRALGNILVSLSHGITHLDSSVSGLGGCPYAGCGSGGNVATEDVVWLLHSLGIKSHVRMKCLLEARSFIDNLFGRDSRARISLEELRAVMRLEEGEERSQCD
jgi:hydroxymethylglutaryl-CoA lyase